MVLALDLLILFILHPHFELLGLLNKPCRGVSAAEGRGFGKHHIKACVFVNIVRC